ncbi:MAG: YggT family protein [Rhodobacteraceae bacterium]|nr:YggT family protein [Paracoccaceae bacterium]
MQAIGEILIFLLDLAWWILIVHIIIGWLVAFNVLTMQQPIVAQIQSGLNRLLDPVYDPVRRILPQTGPVDFSPIIVFIGIHIAGILVRNVFF